MIDFMTVGYTIALGEARSCLAALADTAETLDDSIHYEHLLLALDFMHMDYPGCHPATGTRDELLDRLEAAVDELIARGADGLRMELLLDSAFSSPTSVATPP